MDTCTTHIGSILSPHPHAYAATTIRLTDASKIKTV